MLKRGEHKKLSQGKSWKNFKIANEGTNDFVQSADRSFGESDFTIKSENDFLTFKFSLQLNNDFIERLLVRIESNVLTEVRGIRLLYLNASLNWANVTIYQNCSFKDLHIGNFAYRDL